MFVPKAERPQWRVVLDLLDELDVGDLLTYAALDEAVDGNFRRNRSPLYKAAQVWGRTHQRALAPVANVGYRVVDAPEHEQLARAQHRKSRRAIGRGQNLIRNADRARLTKDERVRFDAIELQLGRHADMLRQLDARQRRTAVQLDQIASAIAEHAERLDRIEVDPS